METHAFPYLRNHHTPKSENFAKVSRILKKNGIFEEHEKLFKKFLVIDHRLI